MSLISHAQSMQDRLDEQFASGRTAQNEARRKYGKYFFFSFLSLVSMYYSHPA